jgi:hypothetical protein
MCWRSTDRIVPDDEMVTVVTNQGTPAVLDPKSRRQGRPRHRRRMNGRRRPESWRQGRFSAACRAWSDQRRMMSLRRLRGDRRSAQADERLQLVLIHDRADFPREARSAAG